jgi:hypothetical protein
MAAIRVKGGRLVDPFNVTEEDVRATDFAHSLSCINRFTGHVMYPYSVAQHTLVLYKHVPKELRRAALIHDFTEAYFNDLASPLKRELPQYKAAEKLAAWPIVRVFDVPMWQVNDVSEYDHRMYRDESVALFDVINDRGMGDDREPLGVDPWFFRERQWRDVCMELNRALVEEFAFLR